MITAQVTESKISAEALAAIVKSASAGAVVTFSGDVRNHDKGREVTSLVYEIHPSAPTVIESITNKVALKYQVENVATAHRYGAIPIGESAFVVAVAAAHRDAALKC
ncbi:MAG: molybdenum cofactor biosynthesis protein MoaE, partial [Candidatus Nanopelagicaceae bacterium]